MRGYRQQNARFPNSSTLSQKVINYLVKCFSYAITQNKGNSIEIKKAIECIVPHAFGDHTECKISCCGYKRDLNNYKHKSIPQGKDLFGESLKNTLNNIFSDYCTETVVAKIAPCSNSQRMKLLTVWLDQKIQKLGFMVAVTATIFELHVLLPKEIFNMLMLTEH